MSAQVTDEDRAAAEKYDPCCPCYASMETLVQAIADARERERKACYVDVCALRCAAHGGTEDGCPCLSKAEQAIAARRSK